MKFEEEILQLFKDRVDKELAGYPFSCGVPAIYDGSDLYTEYTWNVTDASRTHVLAVAKDMLKFSGETGFDVLLEVTLTGERVWEHVTLSGLRNIPQPGYREGRLKELYDKARDIGGVLNATLTIRYTFTSVD